MNKTKAPPGEDFQIRCPRLGHMIHFAYCRAENMGLPCFKTLDCWFEHFMVEEHLRQELTVEEWERISTVGDNCDAIQGQLDELLTKIEAIRSNVIHNLT